VTKQNTTTTPQDAIPPSRNDSKNEDCKGQI